MDDNKSISDSALIEEQVLLCPGLTISEKAHISARTTFAGSAEQPIRVESNVKIGQAAVIYGNVTLGQGAQIRPGAVVTSDVPPNTIVEGNPAEIVGYTSNTKAANTHLTSNRKLAISSTTVESTGVRDAGLYRFRTVHDIRGALSVGEIENDLPFKPKRFFTVYDVPSTKLRGEHAHKECHEFFICLHGSCSILLDDGENRCEVAMDSPSLGLHLPPMVWRTQYRYSADCVAMVFASHLYDPQDYIRQYDEFLAALKGGSITG